MSYQDGPGPVAALGALIVLFMLVCSAVGLVVVVKFGFQIARGLCV